MSEGDIQLAGGLSRVGSHLGGSIRSRTWPSLDAGVCGEATIPGWNIGS